MLKYWDLDRFELLLELPGHHAELWCLAVSQFGDFVVTGELVQDYRGSRAQQGSKQPGCNAQSACTAPKGPGRAHHVACEREHVAGMR
jgi:hypothetical protein